MTDERSILGRVMIAAEGAVLPAWVGRRLAEAPVAGMTLFRHHNVRSPGQVLELTEAFQRAVASAGSHGSDAALVHRALVDPALVAADQEGGQLLALGDGPTAFAGNMALGAVGDADLAGRVGEAVGLEASAMGVNVVFAPVLDVATNPDNPALGIRSFGDDPVAVARLGEAMIRGLQRGGVAATAKHFPGLGEAGTDSHHGLPLIDRPRDRIEGVELVPFRAAIHAGVDLVMSSHIAVPALTGDRDRAATLSKAVMTDFLRGALGFAGVSISDALDMGALAQGDTQATQLAEMADAGVDLFLCGADRAGQHRIEVALAAAAATGAFDGAAHAASLARIAALRRRLGGVARRGVAPRPDLDVVGRATHLALARELAERSLTLVRADASGGSPIVAADATIVAIMPTPTDLTPADTSSLVAPGLATALRQRFSMVEDIVVSAAPTDAEIAAARDRARHADVAVIGTMDARRAPRQAALVGAVADAAPRTIAVSMRTPWDAEAYPVGVPVVATYSILPASLTALAAALAGAIGFAGRSPVRLGIATAADRAQP